MITFDKALLLVPEYIILQPGIDVWKDDDQFFHTGRREWWIADPNGEIVEELGRRPIPESIRYSEARWLMYNSMAIVDPINPGWIFALEAEYDEEGYVVAGHRFKRSDLNFGMRKFASKEAAEAALTVFNTYKNGQSDLIAMLSEGPGALMRWISKERQ